MASLPTVCPAVDGQVPLEPATCPGLGWSGRISWLHTILGLVWLSSFPIICDYENERDCCWCEGHVVLGSGGAVLGPSQADTCQKLDCREGRMELASRPAVDERLCGPQEVERVARFPWTPWANCTWCLGFWVAFLCPYFKFFSLLLELTSVKITLEHTLTISYYLFLKHK